MVSILTKGGGVDLNQLSLSLKSIIPIAAFFFFISIVIILLKRMFGKKSQSKPKYSYIAKSHIMTKSEEKCFHILYQIFSEKYYVFPQVHLSKLLNHQVKGQNFYGAFLHINGKSVDFVLCRKADLKPICAIELDDYTHNWDSRKERDSRVEQIFKEARLPLVRIIRPQDMTKQEILKLFRDKAIENNNQK